MNSSLFKTLAAGIILVTHSFAADEPSLAAYRERLFEYNRLADLADAGQGVVPDQEKAFQNLQSLWEGLAPDLRQSTADRQVGAGQSLASQQVTSGNFRGAAETLKKVGGWAEENNVNLGSGIVAAFGDKAKVRAQVWSDVGSDPFAGKSVGYEMVKLNNGEYVALREDPVSRGKRNQATESTGIVEDLPPNETLGDLILIEGQSGLITKITPYAVALRFPLSGRSLHESIAAVYVYEEPSESNRGGYQRQDSKVFLDRFPPGKKSTVSTIKSTDQDEPLPAATSRGVQSKDSSQVAQISDAPSNGWTWLPIAGIALLLIIGAVVLLLRRGRWQK